MSIETETTSAALHTTPDLTTVGARIKYRREQISLNQEELARRVQVRPASISDWESGLGNPSNMFVPLLATALQCSADWIEHGPRIEREVTQETVVWPLLCVDCNRGMTDIGVKATNRKGHVLCHWCSETKRTNGTLDEWVNRDEAEIVDPQPRRRRGQPEGGARKRNTSIPAPVQVAEDGGVFPLTPLPADPSANIEAPSEPTVEEKLAALLAAKIARDSADHAYEDAKAALVPHFTDDTKKLEIPGFTLTRATTVRTSWDVKRAIEEKPIWAAMLAPYKKETTSTSYTAKIVAVSAS